MPLAPAVAASLAVGLTVRPKAIYLDGLDVARSVRPGSVRLTWAAPGQVSALSFVVVDPSKAIQPTIGQLVRFANLTADLPLFLGWITDVEPVRQGGGRIHRVSCTGVEAMLDWMYVPAVAWVQTTVANILRGLVAMATPIGAPPLNLVSTPGQGSKVGNPIAASYEFIISANTCTTPAGTLRRALEYASSWMWADTSSDGRGFPTVVTVDRWLGLRACFAPPAGGSGSAELADHAVLVVNDAGAVRPSNPSAGYSAHDSPRGVYVKGAGAVTAFVGDGSGIPGRVATITDNAATTTALAIQTGIAYLATRGGVQLTGTTDIEGLASPGSVAGGTLVDAMSLLTFTDSSLGVAAVSTAIAKIDIAFAPSGEETWSVAFGTRLATGAAYLRSLTQDQLI